MAGETKMENENFWVFLKEIYEFPITRIKEIKNTEYDCFEDFLSHFIGWILASLLIWGGTLAIVSGYFYQLFTDTITMIIFTLIFMMAIFVLFVIPYFFYKLWNKTKINHD